MHCKSLWIKASAKCINVNLLLKLSLSVLCQWMSSTLCVVEEQRVSGRSLSDIPGSHCWMLCKQHWGVSWQIGELIEGDWGCREPSPGAWTQNWTCCSCLNSPLHSAKKYSQCNITTVTITTNRIIAYFIDTRFDANHYGFSKYLSIFTESFSCLHFRLILNVHPVACIRHL